jgi:hypothetical protein
MNYKRITLFTGHYGSGKTNIAVAYARYLKGMGERVTVADMDIVNPYFRTKDSAEDFRREGIELIVSEFANSNVDLPALPSELYGVVERRDMLAVLDIGGDDRGAYALGRFSPYIREENDFENLFVANKYRPLTKTPEEALAVMREIEMAGGLPVTAIINNSNLGELTDENAVLESMDYVKKLSELSGLPVKFTSVREDIALSLGGMEKGFFPLKLQKKIFEI